WGFELDLYCRLGGERGLSCRPRRVWAEEYGEGTSDQSLFTGHYFDTETQLYYAKARYFDPQLGRFLSQDSYLGELTEPPSLHRYLYAHDRPTFYVDPDGHIVRQNIDTWINEDRKEGNWLWAGTKSFFKEASYQTLDVVSFGALHRQDKLVDQNLSRQITDEQYHQRTALNVSLSATQAALTFGTGGMGAPASMGAAVGTGALGGVAGQAISDVGEIYGTQTKTADEISARDYLVAAGLGGLGGYAGYRAQAPRAGAPQTVAEAPRLVEPDVPLVPAPAAPAPVADAPLSMHFDPPLGPATGGRELRVLNPHFTPEPVGPNQLVPRIVAEPTAAEGGVYAFLKGGKVKTGSTGDFRRRYGPRDIELEYPQTRFGPAADDSAYRWTPRRQRRFDEEFLDRMVPPQFRYRSPIKPNSPVDQWKWDKFRQIFGYGETPSGFGN
ncbi:MAG: RHS repeat-associated core domain-containing protein, partial [Chloroflexi bacterium]|nr:RHS repeat-associated core domain-containing protein [Chloroflexota bacterium]